MHLIILLIDERPEEVTDIREAIQGPNVEVIYSTFESFRNIIREFPRWLWSVRAVL